MLYWMCKKSGDSPTWPQLEHAIKRNFGGLESEDWDPLKIFKDKLPRTREPPDLSSIKKDVSLYHFWLKSMPINNLLQLHPIVNPDCTRFGLIRASLSSKERTWHGYELISCSLLT